MTAPRAGAFPVMASAPGWASQRVRRASPDSSAGGLISRSPACSVGTGARRRRRLQGFVPDAQAVLQQRRAAHHGVAAAWWSGVLRAAHKAAGQQRRHQLRAAALRAPAIARRMRPATHRRRCRLAHPRFGGNVMRNDQRWRPAAAQLFGAECDGLSAGRTAIGAEAWKSRPPHRVPSARWLSWRPARWRRRLCRQRRRYQPHVFAALRNSYLVSQPARCQRRQRRYGY